MTYSPCVWTASPFGSPKTGQPKRDAPLFPSPLSQSGFHRCTINDALTALATQPKSACITGAIDPFQKSVARIARTLPREAVRIAVLETSPASRRSARRFRWRFTRARSPSRFEFYSKHLESAAPSSATRCDRYPGSDGGVMLRFSRIFAGCCGGRWRGRMRTLKREPRDSSARAIRSARSARRSLPSWRGRRSADVCHRTTRRFACPARNFVRGRPVGQGVRARSRSDQGRFQHGAHQGVTSKQVKRPEIDFCRPRRSPRPLAHAGKGSAPLRRIGARS
jgi:hypothetical protein